jgi:predicted esterase YcpF (UPF0227 family)
MGGVARIIKSVVSKPKAPIQVVQPKPKPKPVEEPKTVTEAVDTVKTDRQKLMGSGYGGSTILSSAAGVEDEANVQKTVLGGGRKRKINA